MDLLFDIWLADRRLHRRARAAHRSLVRPDAATTAARQRTA